MQEVVQEGGVIAIEFSRGYKPVLEKQDAEHNNGILPDEVLVWGLCREVFWLNYHNVKSSRGNVKAYSLIASSTK